jgi:hypothetical protein
MEIKIKLNKNGKPNKNSLKAAKARLKESFETVKPEQLPKQLQGYYRQIESGKKRGEANKNKLRTSTGKFFSAAAGLEFKKLVKSFAIEKGISEQEILKDKELFKIVEQKVLTDTLTITKDTDLLIDFLKREKFENITLVDQNGKKTKVTLEKAILELKENNKKILSILQESKFGFYNKITFNPSGKFAEINYISVTNQSEEQLNDEINEEMESGNFGAFGSPANPKKEPEEEPENITTNVQKAKNKKPNKQGTNKSGNKISKRK